MYRGWFGSEEADEPLQQCDGDFPRSSKEMRAGERARGRQRIGREREGGRGRDLTKGTGKKKKKTSVIFKWNVFHHQPKASGGG